MATLRDVWVERRKPVIIIKRDKLFNYNAGLIYQILWSRCTSGNQEVGDFQGAFRDAADCNSEHCVVFCQVLCIVQNSVHSEIYSFVAARTFVFFDVRLALKNDEKVGVFLARNDEFRLAGIALRVLA